jgi:uncharacterized protein (DUF433 family)
VTIAAILCAKWPGSDPKGREVYAAVPATRVLRRVAPPRPEGWDVQAVVEHAATLVADGSVLVGFDAPIGMPRSLFEQLRRQGARGEHFADWLDGIEDLESFLAPGDSPGDWRPDRPFFRVQPGPGGRQRFVDAARRWRVKIWRQIDEQTGANSPLIAGGIPSVPGGSARNVWGGLKACRSTANAPLIWPFQFSLSTLLRNRVIVAEIFPRLASATALGVGIPPWPLPRENQDPAHGLASLLDASWFQEHRVRIEEHSGNQNERHRFDALISAAALLRLVLEDLPLSEPDHEDGVAEGGMLGSGTIAWSTAHLPAPEAHEDEPEYGSDAMDEQALLSRITADVAIFGGKPIIRGRRLAVEHVLGLLAAGDTVDSLLESYPWLERADVQACLVYARRLVAHERIEPLEVGSRS